MSTRARVVIRDVRTGEENCLYCASDGYIEGIGAEIVDSCKKIPAVADVDSFTMKLLKRTAGLEKDVPEEQCLDWVYEIEFGGETIGIFAREVDWSGNTKRPLKKRLGERIDVREAVAESRRLEKLCKRRENKLRKRLGNCPLCGDPPDLGVFEDGTIHLRCYNFHCANRKDIVTESDDEAVRLWNSRKASQTGCYNKWI